MAPSNTLDTLLHAQRQHGRLPLAFPHDDAPAGSQLVANRLEADGGSPAISVHTCRRPRPTRPFPEEVMGRWSPSSSSAKTARSATSTATCSPFQLPAKHDAGFAHYQMTLRPWLAFLRQRRNNCIFHGKTLEEQTHPSSTPTRCTTGRPASSAPMRR